LHYADGQTKIVSTEQVASEQVFFCCLPKIRDVYKTETFMKYHAIFQTYHSFCCLQYSICRHILAISKAKIIITDAVLWKKKK